MLSIDADAMIQVSSTAGALVIHVWESHLDLQAAMPVTLWKGDLLLVF